MHPSTSFRIVGKDKEDATAMSMPSDTTPDVAEAMEQAAPETVRRTSQLTPDQTGWAVAALVAFLGITYLGPALTRLARQPTRKARMERRWRDARRQARKTGNKVRGRVRQLGGGTLWS